MGQMTTTNASVGDHQAYTAARFGSMSPLQSPCVVFISITKSLAGFLQTTCSDIMNSIPAHVLFFQDSPLSLTVHL